MTRSSIAVQPLFYGETDIEHVEGFLSLDRDYRLVHLRFGQGDGEIEPNYFNCSKEKGITSIQKDLLSKINYLSKAGVVMSVQCLMESLEVSHPLTVLNVMNNLSELGLIVNFEWPEF